MRLSNMSRWPDRVREARERLGGLTYVADCYERNAAKIKSW